MNKDYIKGYMDKEAVNTAPKKPWVPPARAGVQSTFRDVLNQVTPGQAMLGAGVLAGALPFVAKRVAKSVIPAQGGQLYIPGHGNVNITRDMVSRIPAGLAAIPAAALGAVGMGMQLHPEIRRTGLGGAAKPEPFKQHRGWFSGLSPWSARRDASYNEGKLKDYLHQKEKSTPLGDRVFGK